MLPVSKLKHFILVIGIVLGVLLSWQVPAVSIKNVENGSNRDTVQAIVTYGSSFLFDAIEDLSKEAILAYRDSLICMGSPYDQLVPQVDLFLSIEQMEEEQVVELIDSLFTLDRVPYALVNEINRYIANRPPLPKYGPFAYVDTCELPADCFYPAWDTQLPNPYSTKITDSDTAFELLLQGTERLGQFCMPVDDVLTSPFGWRNGRMHNGIDIDLQVWDTVVAAFPGMVRVAKYYGGYGRLVVIRHYNGLETTYAHLHRIKVEPGDVVEAGQLIGLGGSSGKSTGSHLHFEARFKGVALNPLSFIDFKERALLNDTLVIRKTKTGFVAYPKGTLFHTVKRGDCLYDIAQRYGTTTYALAKINGIRRNSKLWVGQRLRVI
ncbi:MAG: peptidoglycan DD-metalloendopeptidase family protein [Salibacteraceae bacterium]